MGGGLNSSKTKIRAGVVLVVVLGPVHHRGHALVLAPVVVLAQDLGARAAVVQRGPEVKAEAAPNLVDAPSPRASPVRPESLGQSPGRVTSR